jgi:PKD repeat protein
MKRTIYILLASLLLLASCKKKDYSDTSTSNQPVFTFNGSINNVAMNIQAGVNNYYMNTSYFKDSNGVYDYEGEFMNGTCTNTCPSSLVIYIKDSKQSPPLTIAHIDSLLSPGYLNYATPGGTPSGYYVNLNGFFNGTADSLKWNFGDGYTALSTSESTTHYYYHPGIYKVVLTTSSGYCWSNDTNYVIVGQVGNAFQCPFSWSTYTLTANFGTVPAGEPPYTYLWNFGDGNTGTGASPTHTYAYDGIYEVTCNCTDARGYTAVEKLNLATPKATGCANGFYQESIASDPNPHNLNNVGIEWYDATGLLWKSENNRQRFNSEFNITVVSDYKNNSAGQPVKMITAQVSCYLYNGLDSIPLTGNVVFGVAHY